ncbi:hypothetical protein [Palleronia pelagia]|uniref:Uncharacterized protein n=1 Tax=Palleronia pelagia TaxID=387096 RepID=A0A1H8ALB3_9RHOB|nr:hypothetical protein [Palleronia pelagia]SEM71431.1 hypothetical protein SAMN04488011_101210 [Palleronia pelagia]
MLEILGTPDDDNGSDAPALTGTGDADVINGFTGDDLIEGLGDSATADWFQLNVTHTAGAGADGVDEAFVVYRPTGQILWVLVDGDTVPSVQVSAVECST